MTYYEEHADECKAKAREYYARHKGKIKAKARTKYKLSPWGKKRKQTLKYATDDEWADSVRNYNRNRMRVIRSKKRESYAE